MRIQKPKKKLYYSLRQVSEMLGVRADEIKQWEKEISRVKPVRNRANNRYYLERDIPILFLIKELLLDKRLTIEETKQELKKHRKKEIESETLHLKKILAEIKMEMGEIRKLLEES